jgi:structural maintenance of chromosome 3 (chondroitin sulfate proteoglycan 6)
VLLFQDLFRGVEAVRQIAIDLKLTGVFGPLIELFTCKAEFHQAVEITAGNSLFHVVVDSDATASTVIHELNRRKAGRVTFVPLNRIEPKRPDYPASPDAMPMIKQLQFEPKFEKAFMQVFGQSHAASVRHGECALSEFPPRTCFCLNFLLYCFHSLLPVCLPLAQARL